MKLYVKGTSKKAVNNRIKSGEKIHGTNYSLFGGGGDYELNKNLAKGTPISIFEKTVDGSPFAKSYGIWNGRKIT